ncbi:MAG: hypothetical protein JXR95_06045 [Deltaproteobacteria bacterium]|nr:hypothetical protein [Deltaproteobacteria bacterium]
MLIQLMISVFILSGTGSKDPLKSLPESYITGTVPLHIRYLRSFLNTPLGIGFKESISSTSKKNVISASNPVSLQVWCSTGGKREAEEIIRLIPSINSKIWLENALIGLARNGNTLALNYLWNNLYSFSISSNSLNQILQILMLNDPHKTVKLLKYPSLSSQLITVIKDFPFPEIEPDLRKALNASLIQPDDYLYILGKILKGIPRKKNVCKKAMGFLEFSYRKSPYYTTLKQYRTIFSQCAYDKYFLNKFIALLGNDYWKLSVLKGLTKVNFPVDSMLVKPLSSLLTEHQGLSGWEKLIIKVLGNVKGSEASKIIASYVMSANLWLREQALDSLSMASDYESGRMLHAAALESAGEEAVLYFIPFTYNENSNAKLYSKNLMKISSRYTRAKNELYRVNSFYACAISKGNLCKGNWKSIGISIFNKYLKEKKYKDIAGLMEAFWKIPSLRLKLRKLVSSENDPVIRLMAFMFLDGKNSKKQLMTIALSPSKELAVNASWNLSKRNLTMSEYSLLMKSPHTEVRGNIIHSLLQKKASSSICKFIRRSLDMFYLDIISRKKLFNYMRCNCKPQFSKFMSTSSSSSWFELAYGSTEFLRDIHDKKLRLYRKVDARHIGIIGEKFRMKLWDGRIYYGVTGAGGALLMRYSPDDSATELTWIK